MLDFQTNKADCLVDFDYLERIGPIEFPLEEIKRIELRRWILSYAKIGGIGAEIGVFRGHFAEVLLSELQPKRLYLVDPWRKLGENFCFSKTDPYIAFGKLTTKYAYEDTKRRLLPYREYFELIFVEDFVENFIFPEKLDWIYLDTTHTYSDTLRQLKHLSNFLKKDGVIFGDDWNINPQHVHFGVFRAVNDFLRNNPDWEFVAAGWGAQWCIRKRTNVFLTYYPNDFILDWKLDYLPRRIEGAEKIIFSGVLVLTEDNRQDSFKLLLKIKGKEPLPVQWRIPSPYYEQKYPKNPNARLGRFKSPLCFFNKGAELKFLLYNIETEVATPFILIETE